MSPTVETVAIAAGSREQEALDEMARTRLGRWSALALVAGLLALLAAGPAMELRRQLRRGENAFQGEPEILGPKRFAELVREQGARKANHALFDALRALEERLGRFSAVSAALRPSAQWHLFHDLRYGNSQVVVGRGGALEYQTALAHLTGRPFLDPRELDRRRRARPDEEPDPVPGLARLAADLTRRGIRLVFVPVPVKAQVHPEMLVTGAVAPSATLANPSTSVLLARLDAAGVATYDPAEALRAAALAGEQVYFATDTHWNPRGMEIAARGLARRIRELGLVEERPPAGLERHPFDYSFGGDLVKLLGLGSLDTRVARETASLQGVRGLGGIVYSEVTPPGDVLLLGDSYSVVFSFDGKGAAGFAEQLAYELDRPVRRMALLGASDLADRVGWLRQNPALLDGVHTVIYEVTARALSVADWTSKPLDRPKARKRRNP